ncbi:hypothetical protein P154DRAFT_570478 [Amniculicola lignicola CBS 123094]|uniref:Uncharacterized protein n=1 Tax=Amniculicola lignicola CBS 123094 TaxID=1392246 RepID=A0A6A5X232_9PLEO|nr:hypothetical protein P154DRAFT_570478 [Amniculicola lignicola CBS 123094]
MPGMARINCLAGQPRAKDGLAFLNKYDGEHIVPEAIHQEELGVLESILPKNTDIPPVNFALVLVMSLSQIGSKIIQGEPGQKYTIYTFVLLLPLMLLLRVSVTLERWSRGFLPPINDPYAYGLGLHVLAGIYLAIIAVVTSPEHKFDSIILIYQVFLLVPELWPALLGGPLRLGPLLGALLGLLYLLPKTEINTTLELPQVQKAVHIAVVITGLYALSVLFLKLDFENWGSAIKRTQKKRVSFQDNRRVMVTRDYIEKNEGLYRRPSSKFAHI